MRSPRGRRLGRVEAVERDPQTAAVAVVLVRRRGRQSVLRVRPEWISLVDPWTCSLVVRRPRRRLAPAWPAAAARGSVRVARAGWGGAVTIALGAGVLVPPAVRLVRATGRRAALLLGLAAWVYGIVTFAVVRVGVGLLLAVAAGALRALAWAAPKLWRAAVRLQSYLAREAPGRPPLRT